jgi:hypothetical protein
MGNTLVLVIGDDHDGAFAPSTISQPGVTWYADVSLDTATTHPRSCEIWHGVVGPGGSTNITVTGNATNAQVIADVAEFSGLTGMPLDQVASNLSASTTMSDTGTTPVTSQANELWIGGIMTGSPPGSGPTQTSPTNMFTGFGGTYPNGWGGGGSLEYLYEIVGATGTANSGTTLSMATQYAGVIATYKGGP